MQNDQNDAAATTPSPALATQIVSAVCGQAVATIERFPTGLMHWVYDLRLADGAAVVIRLNRPQHGQIFADAVAWHQLLAPRGVPLPTIIAYDAAPTDGGCPYMLIERLPGTDLGSVYPTLTRLEKRTLATRISAIQSMVGSLPYGPGFGFASRYTDPHLQPSWTAVVQAELARSQRRIAATGLASPDLGCALADQIKAQMDYLDAVLPQPFLDDTTTKNVLIDQGQLSGIVDVDCLCFGDRLFTVALTNMSLLNMGYSLDYIDSWLAHLSLTIAQRRAFALYTALFCLDFISELGQQFNQQTPLTANTQQLPRLLALYETLLAAIPAA